MTSKLPHALSISLGTPDLGVEEMAYALATFPAQGQLVTPTSILKVIDADGQVLEDHSSPPPRKEVLSPETAYIVTDLMKGVVEVGTETYKVSVEDVTGAGDASLAAFCHALLTGASAEAAAAYGHAAAALTIASTHTVRPDLSPRLVRAALTTTAQETTP